MVQNRCAGEQKPHWDNIKPRANRRKIVGQQLPTLLDVTCCDRLHTLLHVVARSVALQCWIHLHNSSFTGEKCLRKRHEKDHMVDFRQSHWLRGKIPAKHCQDERRNGRSFFFVGGSVVVLLPLREIENYFGRNF